jgi:hypothetical protein
LLVSDRWRCGAVDSDVSGLWLVIDVVLVTALAPRADIRYCVWHASRRDRRREKAGEQATELLYEHGD